ncbi:hypothetical protein IE53DRAFT_370303 [Violaceomyces palustris]|uniref:Uncharacterized protein n=1 Tax=Violaceomyces palustris TaxID=1673888 RepID=A0ACD0NSH4_9BASI|nr:hypothetical protein IE53DRAFT_370303 [Violaceomyces palustris]
MPTDPRQPKEHTATQDWLWSASSYEQEPSMSQRPESAKRVAKGKAKDLSAAGAEDAKPKPRGRINMACVHCRHRKIKCDGKQPICSTCTRLRRHCEYEPVSEFDNLMSRERKKRNKERKAMQLATLGISLPSDQASGSSFQPHSQSPHLPPLAPHSFPSTGLNIEVKESNGHFWSPGDPSGREEVGISRRRRGATISSTSNAISCALPIQRIQSFEHSSVSQPQTPVYHYQTGGTLAPESAPSSYFDSYYPTDSDRQYMTGSSSLSIHSEPLSSKTTAEGGSKPWDLGSVGGSSYDLAYKPGANSDFNTADVTPTASFPHPAISGPSAGGLNLQGSQIHAAVNLDREAQGRNQNHGMGMRDADGSEIGFSQAHSNATSQNQGSRFTSRQNYVAESSNSRASEQHHEDRSLQTDLNIDLPDTQAHFYHSSSHHYDPAHLGTTHNPSSGLPTSAPTSEAGFVSSPDLDFGDYASVPLYVPLPSSTPPCYSSNPSNHSGSSRGVTQDDGPVWQQKFGQTAAFQRPERALEDDVRQSRSLNATASASSSSLEYGFSDIVPSRHGESHPQLSPMTELRSSFLGLYATSPAGNLSAQTLPALDHSPILHHGFVPQWHQSAQTTHPEPSGFSPHDSVPDSGQDYGFAAGSNPLGGPLHFEASERRSG